MCLKVDKQKTAKHSLIKTNKKMRFWKKFELTREIGTLLTPYTCCTVKRSLDYIKPKSFSPQFSCEYFGTVMIEGGCIHAYCKKQERIASSKYIVIPIIVESDDVIAFGQNLDVCFFKYKISNKTWEHIEKLRTKFFFNIENHMSNKRVCTW